MTSFNTLHPTVLVKEKPINNMIYSTVLSGTNYGDAHDIAKDLRIGQAVILFPHHDNNYDRYAVGVYVPNIDGKWEIDEIRCSRLGWVPNMRDEDKPVKAMLFRMLRLGFEFSVSLKEVTMYRGRIGHAAIELRRA